MSDRTIMWLRASSAVRLSCFSRETIRRRSMVWDDERLKGRIRFKMLQLNEGAEATPRYYWPDLQAFMAAPAMRKAIEYVPVFLERSADSFHVEPEERVPEISSPVIRIEAAAAYLDVCRDTIEDRMIDWQDAAVQYRIRSSRSELKAGRHLVRLCYRPDVEGLLKVAPLTSE